MARNRGSGIERMKGAEGRRVAESVESPAAPADETGAADTLRIAVDLLAFGCELWMLATLALSGWDLGTGGLMGICLAIFYPALAIAIWAAWLAPRGRAQLPDPWRFAVQVVLFAATGVIAGLADHVVLGVVFAVVAVGVFAATRVLDPERRTQRALRAADGTTHGLDVFDDRSDG